MASMNIHKPESVLTLAVVGHSNTGKTSLLRTLLHDPDFGEVADHAGTTRQVQGARQQASAQTALHWYDTPGLEDGIALLEYIDAIKAQSAQRLDGPACIEAFLDSPESSRRFEQEARVLRQLRRCKAGLYVVDVREPMQPRHRDELEILSRCGKPLIPILNFLHSAQNHAETWRESFAKLGLHVVVAFDSVAPDLNGEELLYKKLALVLEPCSGVFLELAEQTIKERGRRFREACGLMAAAMIDLAAFRRLSGSQEAARLDVWQSMQMRARETERQLQAQLLELYRFPADIYQEQKSPAAEQRLKTDLFNTEALKEMGIHVGKGFAAGAMAGAGIDLLSGGMTLGAGTILGGVAGGLWQGSERWGRRLLGKLQGHEELTLADPILRAVGIKALSLVDVLEKRGHAAQGHIEPIAVELLRLSEDSLPEPLRKARSHPEWSRLNDEYTNSSSRQAAVQTLRHYLEAERGNLLKPM